MWLKSGTVFYTVWVKRVRGDVYERERPRERVCLLMSNGWYEGLGSSECKMFACEV